MMLSEARTYHAYARECLKLAEEAEHADIRQKLIELSRAWMEAALPRKAATSKQMRANRPSDHALSSDR
jgi:hypothetical protein